MTRDEIRSLRAARELPAGRKLDAIMAAELERLKLHPTWAHTGRWSSDARAVETLVDAMTSVLFKDDWHFTFGCSREDWPKWTCTISCSGEHCWKAEGEGTTFCLAFCRAFLDISETGEEA